MKKMTDSQRKELSEIWWYYGNGGPKASLSNHKFIQKLIDSDRDLRDFYKPSYECLKAVDKIMLSKKTKG